MSQRLEGLLTPTGGRDVRCWALIGVIVFLAAYNLWAGDSPGGVLGVAAVLAVLGPSIKRRSPRVMVPWEVLFLVAAALTAREVFPWEPVGFVGNYLVIAAVALVVAVVVHVYTEVEMNEPFAGTFVAMTTMTTAAAWLLGRWATDLLLGTGFVESNDAMMWELVTAAATGVVAGLLFVSYFTRREPADFRPPSYERPDARRPQDGDAPGGTERDGEKLSDALGVSERAQRRTVQAMQVGLAGAAVLGVAQRNVSAVLTGAISLGITLLPKLLERDYRVQLDVGLVLWISTATFLHILGTLYLYGETFWWHNVTHAVTGSVVAGIGYTALRAVDEHTAAVRFPPRFMAVLILLFVVSVGVCWEIAEFATDQLLRAMGRDEVVLAQFGLDDTMTDMVFNTVGALVVTLWGTAYFRNAATDVRKRMLGR